MDDKLIERLNAKDFERDFDCTPFECGAFGLLDDAATALSALQSENEKLRAELEQVKLERDEAVEYLRGQCRYCKRNLVCTSRKGPHSNCWEWRGPQKED